MASKIRITAASIIPFCYELLELLKLCNVIFITKTNSKVCNLKIKKIEILCSIAK